ncbi:type VI secretion system ATPase TssH [Vibrio fluvialis]|uniref:type VI secretion system ATPase TssH n=1 Tax=Vibrio fluvialis TaxID=676 RepID=UPI0012ADE5FC|nr:type VI secretion system ATPase TssH [Vibrio fluvialis]EKO3428552.1 type VI secretion system ATPase TssH [Vibrio fluvialis]EKO3446173.1 type VI secretion system ATPase TssH [Vibrio fluvialis]EKO3538569.1 type VI secretion system ATPase TssH [Vibrio fluvialis]EKO3972799.1 type VI secretion system ATPase TssH [Vibrio fluvialis]ELE2164901.1 type VI secretion system ATPase TssH [Vibrio fluvialis]
MSQVKLGNLVSKLAPELKASLEEAAGAAMTQTVAAIEIEHWLVQLLLSKETHLMAFINKQHIDANRLMAELTARIERLTKGSASQPAISSALSSLLEEAWLQASVNFSQGQVSSLHLLLVLTQTDSFGVKKLALESLNNVSQEALSAQIAQLQTVQAGSSSAPAASGHSGPVAGGALDKYTVNLTQQAREGKIDPISGRNSEVRLAIDILCRKRQNNPILVGEPGVGKTAVVEGLALRVVSGEVPPAIQGVEIHTLDLGLLQAGASIKGEFENRLKDVINEVKNSPTPIIVFIDEAHTLIGAGGAAGQNDAANLLKPALARGEFRSMAATTWAEYKKYFEKDPALTRRFQVVKVEEPSADDALQMLRGVAQSLRRHHGVFIREDALDAAVQLSIRYLPSRQLPDKAISLLDTACARIALTQGAKPEQIESLEQQLRYLNSELEALENEDTVLVGSAVDRQSIKDTVARKQAELLTLTERWEQEKALVAEIKQLTGEIETRFHAGEAADPQTQQVLQGKLDELVQLQDEEPMVFPMVDAQVIAEVISGWTGIPSGNMVKEEVASLLSLEDSLHRRVIGQKTAINELAKSIRISRAGLTDSRKPVGVFLMCGPSGVGKTETAMALADEVFGGENNMTVINMTEFKEEHKISMLLGSPAGYVGFGEGGVLTEAIRRNPYTVLLLDEMEKAHPGVHDLFYQIFDKGHIKDSEGRTVDFKNTIIIMTSNAADQAICDVCDDNEQRPENDDLLEQIRPALLRHFKPAFLGRTTIVPYYPLNQDELSQITAISLNRIAKKLHEQYKAEFIWDQAFVDFVVGRNTDPTTGGRAVEQIINRSLMPRLAEECIQRLSEGLPIQKVSVSADLNQGGALLLDIV